MDSLINFSKPFRKKLCHQINPYSFRKQNKREYFSADLTRSESPQYQNYVKLYQKKITRYSHKHML